jgi:hypothetical protein
MLVNPVRWVKDRMGHPLEAYLEIEVRDANGKLLTFRKTKAKSLLAQFLGLLKGQFAISYGVMLNQGNVNIIDTSGVSRSYPLISSSYPIQYAGICLFAGEGVGDYGIVVGVSDIANTINQYSMGGQIQHGSGTNQLMYGAMTIESPSNPSGTNNWVVRLIRTFSNSSGSAITVKEIGIIVKTMDTSPTARYFLIARDVISPVTVPANSTLTVRYILKITVS